MIDNVKFSSKPNRKRKGRGIAAGQGKTAGRGTKGQNARSGVSLRSTFEGGQTPLVQRLPKLKGFKSLKTPLQEVKVGQLESIKAKDVNHKTMFEAKLIDHPRRGVKIIAGGELKSAKNIVTQAASAGAVRAIEAQGGSVTIKALHVALESTNKN